MIPETEIEERGTGTLPEGEVEDEEGHIEMKAGSAQVGLEVRVEVATRIGIVVEAQVWLTLLSAVIFLIHLLTDRRDRDYRRDDDRRDGDRDKRDDRRRDRDDRRDRDPPRRDDRDRGAETKDRILPKSDAGPVAPRAPG